MQVLRSSHSARLWVLSAAIACAPAVLAQGHGGGGGRGGGGLGPVSQFREHSDDSAPTARGSEIRAGGLHLAPPGRWWDDERTVRTLGLNITQQKRMDDIFAQNRVRLLELYKGLDHELVQLDRLGHARTLDEAQIDGQIDRVNQVRSDLEKAIAHYQLQLRKEMTNDQTVRMDGLRPEPPPMPPDAGPGDPAQQAPSSESMQPKP